MVNPKRERQKLDEGAAPMAHSIIDEIGRILPPSPNFAETLARAADYAGQQSHPEVTLEHLLLALTEDPDAALVLTISQIEIEQLKGDVSTHLGRQDDRSGFGGAAGISADLRQILEAAAAAARGRRAAIDGAIVLAAIVGDGRSTAAHMLRAHGLTFEEAIKALQQVGQASEAADRPVPPSAGPAPVAEPPQPDVTVPNVVVPEYENQPPIRHPQVSNAEDILATARQRVQGRSVPGFTEGGGVSGEDEAAKVEAAHRTPPHDVRAAEEAADAEFDRMAEEVAATERGTGADEAEPPPAVAQSEAADAEPHATAPAPGPQPALPAKRPLPPGAIRPHREQSPPLAKRAEENEFDREETGQFPPQPPVPPPSNEMPQAPQGSYGERVNPSWQEGRLPPNNREGAAPPFPAPPPGGASGPLPQQQRQPFPGPGPAMPPQRGGPGNGGLFGSSRAGEHGAGPQRPMPMGGPPNMTGSPPSPPAPPGPPGRFPPGPPLPGLPPHRPGPAGGVQPSPPSPSATMPMKRRPDARPAPSGPTPGAGAQARPRASELSLGQMVENIPRSMRVGMPVVVEARVARAEVKAVADGLQGGGAVWRHELTVTKAMSVRLRAPDGGFFIETSSPETQWIENTMGLITDDYASWRWTVTPRERGYKRLQLVISARTVGTDGLTAETALPDQIVDVKVRINFARTARKVGGWALAAIAGGVLARFGEDLPATLAKLVGMVVK